MTATSGSPARTIARLTGTLHNISYYASEMKAFADLGLPEYWRAYMAYRSAPLGMVPAPVVTSTFYNFAPRRVAEAIPSAWATATPDDALGLRDRCISAALQRALGGFAAADALLVDEASELLLGAISGVDAGARPLFAAHRELRTPNDPLLRLWFACTLWREYRGDGHNIALAAAGIDGIECHVLLAARGVGDQSIITRIRGWTDAEWTAARERLAERGLVTSSGEYTEAGRSLRSDIEVQTDELAAAPRQVLGELGVERIIALLEPLVAHLVESGAVAGRWPPPRPPDG